MHESHSIVLAKHKRMGQITNCSCGDIHNNIGPDTINLNPEAFAQVTATMQAVSAIVFRCADSARRNTQAAAGI